MTEKSKAAASFVRISGNSWKRTWGVRVACGKANCGETIEVLKANGETTQVVLGDKIRDEGGFSIYAIERDEGAKHNGDEKRHHARDVERFRKHRR